MSCCRSRFLMKSLVALLLFVETLGHTVKRKQNFAEDTILDDEDAADALPLRHRVASASSWQPSGRLRNEQQRLMLSRLLLFPQGPINHHSDRHPEMMGVAEREWERSQMSPNVIFRGTAGERETEGGESMAPHIRLLPSGQLQGMADHHPIVLGKRDLCCSLDMYCVECTRKRRRQAD